MFATWVRSCSSFVLAGLAAGVSGAQTEHDPGTVLRFQKISANEGGFTGGLGTNDQLGRSVTLLGDLDGDGVQDIASGAVSDDDGGTDQGAVYILFLNRDGTVKDHQKISAFRGDFTGDLDPGDQFGRACGAIGDVDGDGVVDLAVGANFDDDGGEDRGAVWILFLNTDGTVKGHQKISSTQGGFTGELDDLDEFGRCFAPLGDFNRDGVPDLAVGAAYDDDGAWNAGAVWILYLTRDGRVSGHAKISQTQGNLRNAIGERDYFGWSLASVDLDLDGTMDLITGEVLDDDGALNAGAIWVLFMDPDGRVRESQKISQTRGGFTQTLEEADQFGVSAAVIGDLDGDSVPELAVGAVKYDDGAEETGAIFILFMRRDGTVKNHHMIARQGGLEIIPLAAFDWIGSSLAPLGDLDLDGIPDLLTGVRNDDDGGSNLGAIYSLFLEGIIAPPEAGFGASSTRGKAPLEVTFEDGSANTVDAYLWDFGDGTTSTEQNPAHTYAAEGTYTVSLTVTGPGGVDTLTRQDLIVVLSPFTPEVIEYGCGVNPPQSLTLISGTPLLGANLTFGIDNPLGTQRPGSQARLMVSLGADAAFPCGTLYPRMGMAGASASGELLIDLFQLLEIYNGATWSRPGSPAPVHVEVVDDPSVLGLSFFVQGVLIDRNATVGPRIALTNALEIAIGK